MKHRQRFLCVILLLFCLPFTGSAETQSAIFSRETTRTFDDAALSQTQVEQILRAAFAAPTGGDQRACEFVVVTDRDILIQMKAGNPYAQALDTAPLVIVVAVNTNTAFYPELLVLDAGMAAQKLITQATELGFATVPMSISPQTERIEGVSSALNLPGSLVPQIMIAIGYPAAETVSSASTQYFDETRVHDNRYGE